MNQLTNFTPESFDLTKLSLKIPGRQFKVGPQVSDEIDIIQTSVELSIFEHISMPYLTAKLILVDDFASKSSHPFSFRMSTSVLT